MLAQTRHSTIQVLLSYFQVDSETIADVASAKEARTFFTSENAMLSLSDTGLHAILCTTGAGKRTWQLLVDLKSCVGKRCRFFNEGLHMKSD